MRHFRDIALVVLVGAGVISAYGCGGSSGGSGNSGNVNPNPVILSPADGAALPDAVVGTAYVETFSIVSGGTSPYTFNTQGTPAGMSFAAVTTLTAVLQGTPTTQGAGVFQVFVTDAVGGQTVASYTLAINGVGGILAFTPTSAPSGTLGNQYTFTFAVVGGTSPFNFNMIAGSLPVGLALGPAASGISGQAQISGTAGSQGTYPFTISVTDSANPPNTGTQSYNITIN